MKKFISIALLLALCLTLFAGCNEQPQESPKTDLDNAVDYIFNMYKGSGSKDDDIKITSDKEIISVVVIDGVSYNVNWSVKVTSGDENAVAITDGSTANFKKIDLADIRETETKFTLTAEVKDAEGNNKSVSFNYVAPEAKPVEATDEKITIYFPTDSVYITGVQYDYTSSSGTTKAELILSEKKSDAVVFTMKEEDGKITFVTNDGKYLFCDGTNVKLVAEEGEYTIFTLEAAEGGSFIKSNAFYNDNPEKPQYLEVYSGYLTCYGMNADKANIYTFAFHDAEGAGTTTPDTGKEEETDPSEPDTGKEEGTEATEPENTTAAQLPPVSAPVAGTAYKFGVIQVATGNTVYVTGETSNDRFLVTTTDKASALDVYVEEVDGGYKFYGEVNGAKKYLLMTMNGDGKSALYFGDEGTVFAWNSETHIWYASIDGTDYYPGAYNNFETLSASKTSYINAEKAGISQYPGGFFEK